jgi:AcrR family transcriptional regulator
MPKKRNPDVPKQVLLDQSLTCFATHGLHATSMDDLTRASDVSNRVLYKELGNKATIIEAVYAYATEQLLVGHSAELLDGEKLYDYLRRWWLQTAAAAQANPRAFRYWQFYRTSPHVLEAPEPVLGPFAAIPELLAQLLAQPEVKQSAEALPLPVLSRCWAAQWTAAVEVVLADPTFESRPTLGIRLLKQAYTNWWQNLGIADSVPAAKRPAKLTLRELLAQEAPVAFKAAKPAPTGIEALLLRQKKTS